MLSVQEVNVWQKRWQSLDDHLARLSASYDGRDVSRMRTLHALIGCLRAFGAKHFDFFVTGFAEGAPKLQESLKFPPQFALAAILDQIAYDTAVIEQIANQRIQAESRTGDTNRAMLTALRRADYLAHQALKQFQPQSNGNILREKTTVLTYFQKSASVRVIPYAPVVLVAVPYSCLRNQRDLLAIPHEIGHYVYWHGSFVKDNKPVFPSAVLPEVMPDWCRAWFEEIFADVFGVLVAGPVMALDFQDLQLNFNIEDFVKDDGDHPAAILRPYIYLKALEQKEVYPDWTARLRENWQHYLAKRDAGVSQHFNDSHTSGEVKVETFAESRKFALRPQHSRTAKALQEGAPPDDFVKVSEAITTSSGLLPPDPYLKRPIDIAILNVLALLPKVEAKSWPDALPASGDINQLYTAFDSFVQGISQNEVAVPDLMLDGDTLYVGDTDLKRTPGETLFRDKIEELMGRGNLGPDDWLTVLHAAGWTTEGPQCETTGGVCVG